MKTTITDKDKILMATILVAIAQGDPIMGAGELPSGHCYARLMGAVGLVEYQKILSFLEMAGMIRRSSGHLLRITPEGELLASEISAVVRENEKNVTIN